MTKPLAGTQQWFTEIHPNIGSAFSFEIEKKLHEEQTPFQFIEVYRTKDFGNLLVIDGTVQLTERDIFVYHEMMSHPILYTHPHPKDVAIIGGGDCGVLLEVLKHTDVQRVTQIDIDERVTRLAEQYFPAYCVNNQDPRAQLLFTDGVAWIAKQEDASLDVLIVDSTDPVGPAEGLFGKRFYEQCARVLRNDGLLIHQSESPLYYLESIIKPMHQAMAASGFAKSHTLFFPVVGYPSGWWSATMAAKSDIQFADFRAADAETKPFATDYYNAEMHRAGLAMPEFVKRVLV
jgi:spermidine synthase